MEPSEPVGPEEELLVGRRRPVWPWLALAAVVGGVVLAVRLPSGTTTAGRAGASPSTSMLSERPIPVPTASELPVGRPPIRIVPLDTPRVACPPGATCGYVVGPLDQDRAALAATFPGAVVLRSSSYVAQRPKGEVVLARRVVARYGAGRIVITVRKASGQGETQPAEIGDLVVFGNVPGYLVGITVRNAGLPAAVRDRRATALANDPRLLIWPHGVAP